MPQPRLRMTSGVSLKVHYVPASSYDELHSASVLGIVDYGGVTEVCQALPVISVPMPQLNGDPLLEVWSANSITLAQRGNIRFTESDEVLMGCIEEPAAQLERATYNAMANILEFVRKRRYPHLLRIWNYFPGINESEAGMERYKRFCVGRHQAFSEHGQVFTRDLPAASAVGSKAGNLLIYFLAAKSPGSPLENPRQVAAWRYPAQYSPKSPAFARGMLAKIDGETQLYISGTASIVGHESTHVNDVAGQLDETLTNIDSLIAAAATRHDIAMDRSHLTLMKVYLRRAQDYHLTRQKLEREMGADFPILYLQADICRGDLLLEIEGLACLNR